MKTLLGENFHSYSVALSKEEEIAEWNWTRHKVNLVAHELSQLAPLRRLADIGCRNGREAEHYGKSVGAAEIHGFEIAEAPLQIAAGRGIVTHRWVSGEEPCPVADGFFDVIVAGDIIEHLYDTDVFLAELRRVLVPNGHLIVTTPNLAWWWNRLRFLAGRLPAGTGPVSPTIVGDSAIDLKHLRVSVASEWRHLFQKSGFECVSVQGFRYPIPLSLPLGILLDRLATRIPSLAHSLLFVLKAAKG